MPKKGRVMIGLKATTEDAKQAEAIRLQLHRGATLADALRAALAFYCQQKKLDYGKVQLPTQDRRRYLP